MQFASNLPKNFNLWICLCIAFLLSIFRLDDVFLWADEGETLILARNILQWGVPKYFNDHYSLCQNIGVTSSGLWTGQPWFQFYWVAAFMAIFGDAIFFLRLAFVLPFLGCIPLVFLLGRRLKWGERATTIAMLLTATCIPLILASRNVRYYSLLPFFSLALTVLYFDMRACAKKSVWLFGFVSTLFMHTMQPIAAAVIGAFLIHSLLIERNLKLFLSLLKSQMLMLVLFLPWLVYVWSGLIKFYQQRATSTLGRNLSFPDFLFGFGFYLFILIQQGFPLLLAPFVFFRSSEKGLNKSAVWLFGIIIVCICAMMSFIFNSNLFPGYVLAAFPFALLLASQCIVRISGSRVWLIWTLTVLLILSTTLNLPGLPGKTFALNAKENESVLRFKNLGNLFLHHPREFYFFYYLSELASSYDGPVETLVGFLNQNKKNGDTYFASNDGHSIHFATGLKRINEVPFPTPPTWIIPRGHFGLSRNICQVDPTVENADTYITNFIREHPYEVIILDVENLYHENVPAIPLHNFLMPEPNNRQVILRLKE